MKITEIDRIEDLAPLRGAWTNLLHRTPGGSFFRSLEWLEAICKHSRTDLKLRVLILGDVRNPIGITPFVIRREERKLGTARVLSYPLDDWGSYFGPIGPKPNETTQAALDHLLQTKRDWEILDFRWTPPESLDSATTLKLLAEKGLSVQTRIRHQTSMIDLEGNWEDYVASRSKSWRSHFRRQRKKLAAAGKARFERYRPRGEQHGEVDPRWDLFDTCVALAEVSWQGSSKTGNTLNHPEVRDFLHTVHESACKLGCVDMNLLYVDERPISFAYNYCFQGHVFALRLGFDPDSAKLSPGNMVETMAIEDSFERGDTIYELGPDALESKRQLRTRLEPVWQHTHYSPSSVISQLLRVKAFASNWWEPTTANA